jgi:integrase/recombinase XerD
MTSTGTPSITPLRQRMIDDMRMRKLSPKTQTHYIRIVRQFAGFLGRSPDTASAEDLRRYQLYLVDHGLSSTSLNATITGLKFFFETTLDRPELIAKMHPVHEPHKLPVVLSRDEVARLIAAADNLKWQTALSVAWRRPASQRGGLAKSRRHR